MLSYTEFIKTAELQKKADPPVAKDSKPATKSESKSDAKPNNAGKGMTADDIRALYGLGGAILGGGGGYLLGRLIHGKNQSGLSRALYMLSGAGLGGYAGYNFNSHAPESKEEPKSEPTQSAAMPEKPEDDGQKPLTAEERINNHNKANETEDYEFDVMRKGHPKASLIGSGAGGTVGFAATGIPMLVWREKWNKGFNWLSNLFSDASKKAQTFTGSTGLTVTRPTLRSKTLEGLSKSTNALNWLSTLALLGGGTEVGRRTGRYLAVTGADMLNPIK